MAGEGRGGEEETRHAKSGQVHETILGDSLIKVRDARHGSLRDDIHSTPHAHMSADNPMFEFLLDLTSILLVV